MSEEHVAWIAGDGELTESKSLMENWKRFGHDFIGLTQEQFDQVNKIHARVAKKLFPDFEIEYPHEYDFSDLHLQG